MRFDEWKDFKGGEWTHEVNVRNFIQKNYKPKIPGSHKLKAGI